MFRIPIAAIDTGESDFLITYYPKAFINWFGRKPFKLNVFFGTNNKIRMSKKYISFLLITGCAGVIQTMVQQKLPAVSSVPTDFHKFFTYPDGTPVETINDRNQGLLGINHFMPAIPVSHLKLSRKHKNKFKPM